MMVTEVVFAYEMGSAPARVYAHVKAYKGG